MNPGPLKEQSVLLTTQSSLQPQLTTFVKTLSPEKAISEVLWDRVMVQLRNRSRLRESCLPTFHNEELVVLFGALSDICYQTL